MSVVLRRRLSAPEVVDTALLRGGQQPRDGVLRGTGRPPLQLGHEFVLREVLSELQIPRHPCESADMVGRFGLPRLDDGLVRVIRAGLCRQAASVVSPGQSAGASGPVEICRRVEITVTSGQYFAWSSANSRWSATASSRLSYCRMDQPPTTSSASA